MTRPSASDSSSDSESPRSISSSGRKTRPSTLGSSGARTAPDSPSRSANPAAGALAAPATRVRSPPRIRTQVPPRIPASSTAESPSVMPSAQTMTSTTTTESSFRVASLDAYRYATTLPLPESMSESPAARRNALIVNATATATTNSNATPSGPGSSSASHGTAHDRHAYSYSRSYSQIAYSGNDSQPHSQHLQSQSSSRSHAAWNTTIAEVPATGASTSASDAASAEANSSTSRSPIAGYGSTSVFPAGYLPNRPSSLEHDHVGYYPGPAVPPSLASYILTSPAVHASVLRDVDDAYGSSSSTTTWQPSSGAAYGGLEANRRSPEHWQSYSPALEAHSRSSFSVQPSYALQGSSPTHTNSPENFVEATPSSWARIPPAASEADRRTQLQTPRQYGNNLLSANISARPSLTQSVLASSASSSSVQLSTLPASGASNPSAAPTSATASTAAASHVPEFANPYSHSRFASHSPVSPRRQTGIVAEPNAPLSRLVTTQPRTAATEVNVGPLSSSSTAEAHYETYQSPQYDSETHSPTSSRLTYPYTSPGNRGRQQDLPALSRVPVPRSRHAGQTVISSIIQARASPSSSSGATTSGPSESRGTRHSFVGTNTGTYANLYGGSSASGPDPGASSLAARSSPSASLNTVPVTISSVQRYDYPYVSSSYTPAPAAPSVPASTVASTPGAGASGSQNTRKRNHPCWMCHKSFDRPSTLRKHFLVHTGEKAYVCEICGRRFGVASNLNRHTRRCIARPVNSATFHRASTSASASTSVAGPSSSASALSSSHVSGAMAREQTNPDVRRSERERDGHEIRDDEQPVPPPETTSTSQSTSRVPQSRRRGRSPVQSPLGGQSLNTSMSPESQASSSQQTSYQLRPAFESGPSQASGSGQVAVATASTSTNTAEAVERRPKRRRRAPSPSNWVPESLRNFSLSPVRQRTSTPLPPVSPGYDAATGTYEERDSYATITDENVDPSGEGSSGENSNPARTREERLRNFEYAPYHECGWTGRLPGPAVVGNDVTNYTKSAGGGSGSGGRYSGGNTGGAHTFMIEFSLAAAG